MSGRKIELYILTYKRHKMNYNIKYKTQDYPVDILFKWLPRAQRSTESLLIHHELGRGLAQTWKGLKETSVSQIKLSEKIKEMTKDKIWQPVNKRGVLIIILNKYSITWFIIIKHIYNKIISCLWF